MIDVNDIPQYGTLIIEVFFGGYKDSYPNDARRFLKDSVVSICSKEKLSVEITPLTFSLIKTVSGSKNKAAGKATGAQYQYGYSNMTGNDLKIIFRELRARKLPWFEEIKFLIANNVEGLE